MSDTSVTGVVLDNSNIPLPGVEVSLTGESFATLRTTSNEQGQFVFNNAPVGTVHVNFDASTTTATGDFPRLGFEIVTVSGRENTVGLPVYIPRLDTAGGKMAGGNQQVVIPLAGVEGAEIIIAPNSVTLPDGRKEGVIMFSQVQNDKTPMPAPDGVSFDVAWTLQPSGTLFDPPARVSLPNTSGGIAGQEYDMVTFDHDLGEWVSMGPGIISEDGSTVTSKSGYGIREAGWGGLCPPPNNTCNINCDDKNECTTDTKTDCSCENKPDPSKDDMIVGSGCEFCDNGSKKPVEVEVSNVPDFLCINETEALTVTTMPPNLTVAFSSANGNFSVTESNGNYELKAISAAREKDTVSAKYQTCFDDSYEIMASPASVNDVFNFPLVGDPARAEVNEAFEYLSMYCTAQGTQNTAIGHSIDGCSGGAPQRLTDGGFVTGMQFEVFDKFVTEPVWGQARAGNIPFGSSDPLSCNTHDICYQTCGSSQSQCDNALEANIAASCNVGYPNPCPLLNPNGNFLERAAGRLACADYASELVDCLDIARNFNTGLSIPVFGGVNAWRTRQVQYCECCN